MLLLRALGAAAGGLALWLAFPSANLWFLAPVGMACIVLAITGTGGAVASLLGMVAGWAYFGPLLSWSGIYVGALPWFALATLSSLYVAAFSAVASYLQGRGPDARVRPVAVALAWVVAEYARATTPFGGFPWGRLGFSQADSPALGLVRWVGVPGLGFVLVLSGALIALGVHTLVRRSATRRSARGVGSALVAIAVAVAVMAAPMLIERPMDGPTTEVMAIQGNVPEMTLDFNAQRRAVLDNHVTATRDAAAAVEAGDLRAPELVVWPENSSDIDPVRNPDAARVIDSAIEAIDAPVVVGAVLTPPGGRLKNASLLYLPGKGIVQSYVKQRPVPFAEYIPYRTFFRRFSDKVDLVRTDFAPGREVGLLEVPIDESAGRGSGDLPLGVAICFEVVVDDLMARTVREGAEIMLVPTNNATFGFTDESVQQLAASRVKAVELGRSVVHISTVGVSGFVAPDGSVSQRTDLFTSAVLSESVTRRTEITPAVRLGPWPERVASVILALLVLLRAGQGLRRRSHRHTPLGAR
ncbi:MAG: apolipoprotein N-acyltransferase [Ornithinimicrobium sp.]